MGAVALVLVLHHVGFNGLSMGLPWATTPTKGPKPQTLRFKTSLPLPPRQTARGSSPTKGQPSSSRRKGPGRGAWESKRQGRYFWVNLESDAHLGLNRNYFKTLKKYSEPITFCLRNPSLNNDGISRNPIINHHEMDTSIPSEPTC